MGPHDIQTYFVDGNPADYSNDSTAGYDLDGLKGTSPETANPDPAFNKQLMETDPKLDGLHLQSRVL